MKDSPILKLFIITYLLLFSSVQSGFSQVVCESGCDVAVSCGDLAVSGGLCIDSPTFFCEGEIVCVENNSDPASFDEWVVWWDDGMCDTYPNTITTATHSYNFVEDTCLVVGEAMEPTIFIKNIKYCGNGNEDFSLNCVATFIKIIVNPIAGFATPNTICRGQEACITNASCENADSIYYNWYVDGIFVSDEIDLCYIFDVVGSHEVSLVAVNVFEDAECGRDSTFQNVIVRDTPIAIADFIFPSSSACVPSVAHFLDQSIDADSIEWIIEPDEGYQFLGSELSYPDTAIRFDVADSFKITAIASSACGMDTTMFEIVTFDFPNVDIMPPPVVCGDELYQPEVSYSGTIDTISWYWVEEDMLISEDSFPEISLGNSMYTIRSIVSGPCGQDTAEVVVSVLEEPNIFITPVGPICAASDTIHLSVSSSAIGNFGCSAAVTPEGVFDPSIAIIGTNIICYEVNAGECSASDTIEIIVQNGAIVDVGGPEEICIDNGLSTLVFSPSGGEWSGNGITNPMTGTFDPILAGIGPHTLTYRYGDLSGCVTFKTKIITVVALPLMTASDATICQANMNFDLADLMSLNFPSSDPNLSCELNGEEGCNINPSELDATDQTIVFTYTTSQGCNTTEFVTLTVTELTPVETPPDTTVCQNQALTLQGFPENCGSWSPQPFISIDGIVATNLFINSQIFTYACNTGTECETSASTTVMVKNGAIVPLDDWVCETESTYSLPLGTPTGGTWSGDALFGDVIIVDDLMPGDFTYTYTVASLPDACESADFILHVDSIPISNFTHEAIACADTVIGFINTSTGGTQYLWHFGDANNTTSTDFEPQFSYAETGDYKIILETWTIHPLSGETLCLSEDTSEIHISEPPQELIASANNLVGCGPLEVDFSLSSIGENMEYQWDFGMQGIFDGAFPPTQFFEQMEMDSTFYNVILKGWNNCDTLCDTLEIVVLPSPAALFGIQFDEPCSGGELILNNLSQGNPANNVWTIHNITLDDTLVYNEFNPPPITVFASDTEVAIVEIRLETTNECGQDVFMDTIMVLPSPIIAQMNFSSEELCVNDTLFLTDISTPGTIPNWKITMSNNDVFFFNGDSVAFVPTVSGSFSVVLFADGCGFDSIELVLEAMPSPNIDVAFDPFIPCEGQAVQFDVETEGNGMTLFYGDGDFTDLNISEHIYNDNGPFLLFIQSETPFGCQSERTGSIDVAASPSIMMDFTDSVCAGTESLFLGQGVGVESWAWNFCDTCIRDGEMVNYTFPSSGIQLIQLVGVSPFGCSDTIERSFFVRPTPVAIMDVEILQECTPAEIVLHDLSTQATGIAWQLGDGQSSFDNTAFFTIQDAGDLAISLVATNGGICSDTTTRNLSFFETPNFTVTQEPNCTEEEGTAISVQTTQNNFVKLTGENYDIAGNFHQKVPNGDYLVQITSIDGCKAEQEVFVSPIQELFIQLAQYQFEIDLGEEVQLEAIVNQQGINYSWSPAIDLDNSTIATPLASPLISTFYAVEVSNDFGCIKYDTAFVRVNIDRDLDIFIPNTFTPNLDGHNDLFRLRSANPGLANILSFQIFDRWGEKVYEAYDCEPETSACGWDGTFRGQKAEMGNYIWLAELEFVDGAETRKRGGVLLVR